MSNKCHFLGNGCSVNLRKNYAKLKHGIRENESQVNSITSCQEKLFNVKTQICLSDILLGNNISFDTETLLFEFK